MPEVTGSCAEDRLAAVRAYVSDAVGCPAEAITAVAPFEDGNRHEVYRVSYREASDAVRDVVVRVSYGGDAADLACAEREAAVLQNVGGVAAPRLYDFRGTGLKSSIHPEPGKVASTPATIHRATFICSLVEVARSLPETRQQPRP